MNRLGTLAITAATCAVVYLFPDDPYADHNRLRPEQKAGT